MQTTTTEPDAAPVRTARRDRRYVAAIAAAMLLVYVAAHAALLSRFPWVVDETFFAVVAQNVQGDPNQRFLALIDHKGLDVSWIAAFLIHFDVPPMDAMRLISIGSGIVAAVAVGYTVWRWRSSLVSALLAGGLVAFVPYMFVHDSVGIYDPFVTAGSMVALALQLEVARRRRLDLAMILGFVLGVVILAKPTGNLAILLWPVSLLVFDWRREGLWRRMAGWLGLVALALLIAGAMYGLTRLSPLAYTPEPQNHRTVGDFFSDPFANWHLVASDAWDAMWGYMTPPGVILACWGAVCALRTRDRLGLVAIAWAAAAIAAFLFLTDTAYPRYGLQAVPPLCILIVIGGEDVWRRARRRVHWRWLAPAAVLAAVPMLLLDAKVLLTPEDAHYPGLDRLQYVTYVSNRQPARNAAQEILRIAPNFTAATPAPQRTVAELGGWPWATTLTLNGTHFTPAPRFTYIDDTNDHRLVNTARFVIVEGPPPPWLTLTGAKLVKQWSRAGNGPPVVLYDRHPRLSR
jgi:hypothetical protein